MYLLIESFAYQLLCINIAIRNKKEMQIAFQYIKKPKPGD